MNKGITEMAACQQRDTKTLNRLNNFQTLVKTQTDTPHSKGEFLNSRNGAGHKFKVEKPFYNLYFGSR